MDLTFPACSSERIHEFSSLHWHQLGLAVASKTSWDFLGKKMSEGFSDFISVATMRQLGCCHRTKWPFLYGVTQVRCYWPLHHLWQKSLGFNCLFKTSTRQEKRSERMCPQSHTECDTLILWCTHYCLQREFPRAKKPMTITEDFVQFFLSLSCCVLAGSPYQNRQPSTADVPPRTHSQVVALLLLPLVQYLLSHTFSEQRAQWQGEGHKHQAELSGQNLGQHHSAEGYGEIVLRRFLLSIYEYEYDTLAGQVHGQEPEGDLQWY